MSKNNKNKNNNVETEEVLTEVVDTSNDSTDEIAETVKPDVETENTEVVEDKISDDTEVTTDIEVEETKADKIEYKTPEVVEIKPENIPVHEDELPESTSVEADPLPELDGNYYITLGSNLSDDKLKITTERLDKTGLTHIVTATGEVLAGPFVTESDAISAKKLILGKGLRGTIKTM